MKNIRDWREATLMLSFEEKGYFDELINLIYIYDDCLPDKDDLICRAMPVHKKLHLRLKRKLIEAGLITIKGGFYFNKRASLEVEKINQISERNKIKALNRWAKSSKRKTIINADAGEGADAVSDANRVLNQKVNSESDGSLITKRQKNLTIKRSPNDKRRKKKSNRLPASNARCSIEDILDPDGKVPEEYRNYAEEQGLSNTQRIFTDWANWWVSENGRKAGARGWLATWKARVRKDVDRQRAKSTYKKEQSRAGSCTTALGARLALDRRRDRQGKV